MPITDPTSCSILGQGWGQAILAPSFRPPTLPARSIGASNISRAADYVKRGGDNCWRCVKPTNSNTCRREEGCSTHRAARKSNGADDEGIRRVELEFRREVDE